MLIESRIRLHDFHGPRRLSVPHHVRGTTGRETQGRLQELLLLTIEGTRHCKSILLDLTEADGIDDGALMMLRQIETACSQADVAMQVQLGPDGAARRDGAE